MGRLPQLMEGENNGRCLGPLPTAAYFFSPIGSNAVLFQAELGPSFFLVKEFLKNLKSGDGAIDRQMGKTPGQRTLLSGSKDKWRPVRWKIAAYQVIPVGILPLQGLR